MCTCIENKHMINELYMTITEKLKNDGIYEPWCIFKIFSFDFADGSQFKELVNIWSYAHRLRNP